MSVYISSVRVSVFIGVCACLASFRQHPRRDSFVRERVGSEQRLCLSQGWISLSQHIDVLRTRDASGGAS